MGIEQNDEPAGERQFVGELRKNGFVAYRGLVADGADEPVSEPGQPEGVDEKSPVHEMKFELGMEICFLVGEGYGVKEGRVTGYCDRLPSRPN